MSTAKFARRSRRRGAARMGFSKLSSQMVVRGYTRNVGMYNRFNRPARKPEQKCIDWHYGDRAQIAGAVGYPLGTDTMYPSLLTPQQFFNLSTGTAQGADGHLLQIAQGAGLDQRIGRKIQVKSMEITGTLFLPCIGKATPVINTNDFSANETHHMWIVVDTQVNGLNTGQAAQIWQPNPVAASAPNDVLALRNLGSSSRFKILKHIVTPITRDTVELLQGTPPTYVWATGSQKQLNVFLKLDLPIEFSNTVGTGVVGTLRDNGIFIFTAAQAGTRVYSDDRGTDPCAKVMVQEMYNIRIRYTDV